MKYSEYIPCEPLRKFVKCYYLFETDSSILYEDKAFATGSVEIMFNLGGGKWQTNVAGKPVTNPNIELWGQIVQPLTFQSLGQNTMLGIRFFPHTASLFINDNVSLFNDRVTDLNDVVGKPVLELHEQLLETTTMGSRILLVENFLLKRLSRYENKVSTLQLLDSVLTELNLPAEAIRPIEDLAAGHGITSRYLHKLFLQYAGVSPKLYHKINRFQNSLVRVGRKDASLTTIAYECGYFDQSHFIREFKAFTGSIPSAYDPGNSSALWASPGK